MSYLDLDIPERTRGWVLLIYDPTPASLTPRAAYSDVPSPVTCNIGFLNATDGLHSGATFSVTTEQRNIPNLTWAETPDEFTTSIDLQGGDARAKLDLRYRDTVILLTKGVGGLDEPTNQYFERARGTVTMKPSYYDAAGDTSDVQLIGLTEVLKTIDAGPSLVVPAGTDVLDAAEAFVNNADDLPNGVAFTGLGLAGQTLTAPIANDGDSLYDVLAAVTSLISGSWVFGVLYGRLVVQASTAGTASRTEGVDCDVEYQQDDASNLATSVRWDIASSNLGHALYNIFDDTVASIPDPLTHVSDSGNLAYGARHTVRRSPPDSVAALKEISGVTYAVARSGSKKSYVDDALDTTFTLSRCHDGRPGNSIALEVPSSGQRAVRLRMALPAGTLIEDIVAVSLDFQPATNSGTPRTKQDPDTLETTDAERMRAKITFSAAVIDGVTTILVPTNNSVPRWSGSLIAGDRARSLPTRLSRTEVESGNSIDLEIEYTHYFTSAPTETVWVSIGDFRAWTINDAELDNAARDYYLIPKEDALTATLPGEYVTGIATLTLTTATGATLSSLAVDTIEHELSQDEGIATRLIVGPRFGPTDKRDLVLINGMVRQSVARSVRAANRSRGP